MIYDFLGVTPVSPDATAGSDVRSEPDYEALNAEIEKMANPSAGEGTDWQRVAELASGLLADKGKDLRVACYLGVALIQLQQVQGCSLALKYLRFFADWLRKSGPFGAV
ncbi:MAG: type VI secretion system ImpA family N-terminal domain-containing protein [Candidatus Binataceae bacterium]